MFCFGIHRDDICRVVLYPGDKVCGSREDVVTRGDAQRRRGTLGSVSCIPKVEDFSHVQIQNHGDTTACLDAAAQFIPNQVMLVIAEFCISVHSVETSTNLRHAGCGSRSFSFDCRSSRSGSA